MKVILQLWRWGLWGKGGYCCLHLYYHCASVLCNWDGVVREGRGGDNKVIGHEHTHVESGGGRCAGGEELAAFSMGMGGKGGMEGSFKKDRHRYQSVVPLF